jgi:hypothetical protein
MPRARFSAHLLAASLLSLGALLSRAHLGLVRQRVQESAIFRRSTRIEVLLLS